MARTTKPLTDTQVKQSKAKEKEYNLADGKGLYLRIKPNGSKLWLFNYSRPYTKKRANLGLGQYPSLSLANARTLRNENLELLAQNIDPSTHRTKQKKLHSDAHNNTLKQVTKSWFLIKKSQVSSDHASDLYRSLELHIFPKMGEIPIHLIRAKDAIDTISPIAAKGSLETVKRLCQRLNEVMVYAVNTGLVNSNPLFGISNAFESPIKKHMPTIKPDQLPQLINDIANASIKKTTRYLIEWQLHTITRPNEAAGTRWEEIDFENEIWVIPAERMKKKKRHFIPLTTQALRLLEIMKPISKHREHVFPADRNPRSHTNPQTVNMALKRMGYGGQLVAHGLRSLASTILNEHAFNPDVIEAALSHTDKNDVRGAYNRAEYLERRKSMLQWWSNHIEESSFGSNCLSTNIKYLKMINT